MSKTALGGIEMNRPEINVTPLIDILLVLLIIFMIVTPVRPSKFEAKIPSRPDPSATVNNHPLTLVVSLANDSSISLNNEKVAGSAFDTADLIGRLREVFTARESALAFADETTSVTGPRIEKTVFIKAPTDLSYGTVTRVVDAVKAAGADPVSLQIDGLDQ